MFSDQKKGVGRGANAFFYIINRPHYGEDVKF